MRIRAFVRRVPVGVGAMAFLVGAATLSSGWPIVDSNPFTPIPVGQTKNLWRPQSPTRVGVTVTVTGPPAADARVMGTIGGVQAARGHVSAGRSYVLEGVWESLDLFALTPDVTGSYAVRQQPAPGVPDDGLVGSGSVALTAGGTFCPYANFSPPNEYRALVVQAPPGTVPVVVSTPANPAVLTVGGGDWGFCGIDACPQYCVSGTGTIGFWVFDMNAGSGPCTGGCSGAAGETDRIALDGTKSLVVTLRNTGTNPIQVSTQIVNQPIGMAPLPPNAELPFSGLLSRVEWTYMQGPGSIQITVSGQPTQKPPPPLPVKK